MFEPPILTIKGARLSFGTNELFTNVELYINRGDKISLVGRNGCGKSTLLKVIARDIEPDAGEIFVQPGVKVSYMPQDPDFSGYATLREVVLSGLPEHERGQEYRADILIEQFDIRAEQSPEQSSGGERKKAALAKALINEPDILLLDEPTNHLDIDSKEILERAVNHFEGTVLYVSHDRYFINRTATRILDLTQKQLVNYIGNYDYYLEKKEANEQAQLTTPVESATDTADNGASDSKLTWQQQKEEQARLRKKQNALNKVEKEISQLEAKNEFLDEQLSDPKNWTDIALLQKLASEKEANDERLLTLMEEWENLAED